MSNQQNDHYNECESEAREEAILREQDERRERLADDDELLECPLCGHIKKSNPTPNGDEICPSCWNNLN